MIKLNSSLQLLASGPPASQYDISLMKKYFPNIPQEYLDLLHQATEIELQTHDGKYFRIWEPIGCIDMEAGHGFGKHIVGAIPVGDDGGGSTFIYFRGEGRDGLYLVSNSNIDINDAIFISPSLNNLLFDGEGIENI